MNKRWTLATVMVDAFIFIAQYVAGNVNYNIFYSLSTPPLPGVECSPMSEHPLMVGSS